MVVELVRSREPSRHPCIPGVPGRTLRVVSLHREGPFQEALGNVRTYSGCIGLCGSTLLMPTTQHL